MAGCVKVCDCNFSMSNTGTDCTPLMQVTKKLMLIPYFDSTGVQNFIDLTTSITASTFTAMINQADASKRLYPLPPLKDIKDTRGNPIVQKFADDSTIFVRDGIRAFDGMIPGVDGNPILKGKIEAARCGDMGVYLVDRLGNLIGVVSSDNTKLYPIRLDSESISAQYLRATDTTVQALQLTFNFHPDESDSCLRIVTASEMGDATLLNVKGLINVYATFTSPATTGITVKLYTEYGDPINPTTVKGLLIGDLKAPISGTSGKVRDETSNTDITPASVTESSITPGTYAILWTVTSGHNVGVGFTKNGFDFTNVASQVVAVP